MRGYEKARKKLAKETNIIDIVKSCRDFNKAIKFLISKELQAELQFGNSYYHVDPDTSMDSSEPDA